MTRSCTGIWLTPSLHTAVNSRDRAATRLLSDVAVSLAYWPTALTDVPAGDLLDDWLGRLCRPINVPFSVAGDAHENSWITRADDRSEGMLYVGVLIRVASGEAKYALSRSVAARCAGASLLL